MVKPEQGEFEFVFWRVVTSREVSVLTSGMYTFWDRYPALDPRMYEAPGGRFFGSFSAISGSNLSSYRVIGLSDQLRYLASASFCCVQMQTTSCRVRLLSIGRLMLPRVQLVSVAIASLADVIYGCLVRKSRTELIGQRLTFSGVNHSIFVNFEPRSLVFRQTLALCLMPVCILLLSGMLRESKGSTFPPATRNKHKRVRSGSKKKLSAYWRPPRGRIILVRNRIDTGYADDEMEFSDHTYDTPDGDGNFESHRRSPAQELQVTSADEGHLIANYFFLKYNDLDPGRLTDLKKATVNNENFARIAVKHNFHLHLQHGSAPLQAKINSFVESIQNELDAPGLNSLGLGDLKAPKVLGDIFESIAGAVVVDSGLNTEKLWQIFEPLMQPLVTPDTLLRHPVSELQERCQQRVDDLRYHSYQSDPLTFVVEVYVNEELIASADNTNRTMARKLAARDARLALKQRDQSAEATAEENISSDVLEFTPMDPEAQTNITVDQVQQNYDNLCVKRNCKQTLDELCVSKKWLCEYKCVSEVGPPHARKFTFSVQVLRDQQWSKEYVGNSSPTMRKAKVSAAAKYLQSFK
ncbi:hypothetical protein R1flu_023329 [Riccia fluitans]|uniref:DRBM domain-containing protein n=1 Tax=Riccia fluitans TaxID=41844 RepID=A0ABD1XRW3_9MARC